ncbi:free fatty acid receptor 3-like [Heterodontus francisci]|uniref:free fatty acid receptor 3-like n=1 Tax=Heterodontus francisci TaxID=7792 RepID=UPI00355BB9DC
MVYLSPLDILSLSVHCITFILGAPANALALCVFFKDLWRKPTPNVIYMINLGISNSLFIILLPVKIVETARGEWILPDIFCPIYNIFHFVTTYASILFLTALSVGRYLSVAFPIRYKMYRRPRYSCMICFVLWLIVTGHISFIFLVEANGQGHLVASGKSNTSICYGNFTRAQLDLLLPLRLELSIVLFLLPLALTSLSYLGCIRKLGRSRLPQREKQKALWAAAVTLTMYVTCFAPYNISHLVGFALRQSVPWRREALLLSAASVFLNPLIFFFSSSTLQRATTECWRGAKQRACEVKESLPPLWHSKIPQGKDLNGDHAHVPDPVP